MTENGRLRIGELSRRVGESPELLRAWEMRYGLVEPERSSGGLRLYSERDEQRVRAMRRLIDAGLSASEAARLAMLADAPGTDAPGTDAPGTDAPGTDAPGTDAAATLSEIEAALERSFDALDEPGAQAALDRLLIAFGLRQALAEVILPFLHRLGERWAAAEASVAQEHFASNIISGRLRGLAQGWGQGVGPRAILACPPGELHELGLLCFGLALREQGWRVTYIGADTPIPEVAATAEELSPAIVVLAAVTAQRFLDSGDAVTALAAQVRVAVAGAGASAALAERLGAEPLVGQLTELAVALRP